MKYFTIQELSRSKDATKLNIDNTPSDEVVKNLETLVHKILDPAREFLGVPIIVNSGYRCEKLNKAVGGVKNSQHVKGEAADITTGTRYGNMCLYEFIKNNLIFDQLINEYDFSWVHVSYTTRRDNRKHFFAEK